MEDWWRCGREKEKRKSRRRNGGREKRSRSLYNRLGMTPRLLQQCFLGDFWSWLSLSLLFEHTLEAPEGVRSLVHVRMVWSEEKKIKKESERKILT